MKSYLYEELSSPEIKNMIDVGTVLLISLGSIEQHGPHLPVGTDILCMNRRVAEIAKKSESIMLSPLCLGYSFNHKGMLGTISLSSKVMLELLTEVLEQLCEQGWKKIIIFSGHNGNWGVVELSVQKARETFPLSQFVLARGIPRFRDDAHRRKRFVNNFDYHAGMVETSIVAYYFPELINKESVPTGNLDLPRSILSRIHKSEIDDIEELLIKAVTPQKTEFLSRSGVWGITNPQLYRNVPVQEAMLEYESFFVELINRWKKGDDYDENGL